MEKISTIHEYIPSEIGIFSDIHGDIDTLITTLRDVLSVIKKRENHPSGEKTKRDPELDTFLNLDLNDSVNKILYNETLNYEWCGSDKVVVIVGDILDATRLDRGLVPNIITLDGISYTYTGNRTYPHYYPQIEYKILLFINGINADAQSLEKRTKVRQGKIIKVSGNHEFMNMYPTIPINETTFPIKRSAFYCFPDDLENSINKIKQLPNKPYMTIDGIEYTRFNFFEFGNPGYDALKVDLKLSYKIGNYIFVHGQLTTDLTWTEHNDITNFLINIPNYNDPILTIYLDTYKELFKKIDLSINAGSGPLWDRIWGSADGPNRRIGVQRGIIKKNSIHIKDDAFCTDVSKVINIFCSTLPENDLNCTQKNPDASKGVNVVLGHCIQSDSTIKNESSMTFIDQKDNEFVTNDKIQMTYGNNIYYGKPLMIHHRYGLHYKPIIYGITTECIGINQNHIYRVDVGSSRGFDHHRNIELLKSVDQSEKINTLNQLYFSRTPQALRINVIKDIQAISKSKMINTINNVPRPDLNTVIKTLEINGPQGIVNILDTYDRKYRKYKQKYLLKNIS
jgi:hypothetical protein